MSESTLMRVGSGGRIVLPAALRKRLSWSEGTTLVAVETKRGVVLTRRDELERLVREQLRGKDLVAELIEDRQYAASRADSS